MMKSVQGTSQWRKLIFSKEYSDDYGSVWRVSTWKVGGWLIAALLLLILLYSFFVPSQGNYLTDVLFYAIITVVVVLVVWFISSLIWKSRSFIAWFLIGLASIFIFYIVMGFALSFFGWKFSYGFVTWIFITTFALIGAAMKDKSFDRKDFLFGILVFIILVGANAPVFGSGIGFLTKLDDFIKIITDGLSKIIDLGNLFAK